jgi:hypothetical protein
MERKDVVKKIMNEKGFSMIEASKYVKKNNLYTPKTKTKVLLVVKK